MDCKRSLRVKGGPLLFALVLVGCGGGGTPAPPAPSNPIPSVTAVAPPSVTASANGEVITVTGQNFVPLSTVNLGTTSLATTFVSGAQLIASVPGGTATIAGHYLVTVTNPTPGGGTSTTSANLAIAPAIVSVHPANGPVGSTFSITTIGGDPNNPASNSVTFAQTGRTFSATVTAASKQGGGVVLTALFPQASLQPARQRRYRHRQRFHLPRTAWVPEAIHPSRSSLRLTHMRSRRLRRNKEPRYQWPCKGHSRASILVHVSLPMSRSYLSPILSFRRQISSQLPLLWAQVRRRVHTHSRRHPERPLFRLPSLYLRHRVPPPLCRAFRRHLLLRWGRSHSRGLVLLQGNKAVAP